MQQQPQHELPTVVAAGEYRSSPYVGQTVAEKPSDYYTLSIFTLLCCCWPIGFYALKYSNKVRNLFAAGDLNGAKEASKNAITANIIGIILGVLVLVGVIVYVVMVVI
ncbi:trafficking regulator of GLUT4 1-like [Oscarella lobularis]|uniref:trafficking regulator of GLUT4 1-like n=1 Tax=Oscarella lobularis TaxID=121494 RepID=UPI003313D117